jgi:hypothetical protein
LETDAEIEALFRCLHTHLAPTGSCVLNVFRPVFDPETLRQRWVSNVENLAWEVPVEGGKLVCSDRRPRMDAEKLILYPELIYRLYEGDRLVEKAVLKLVMRCYYPETFERLIQDFGFKILDRWGGYEGEVYSEGPELVIQFT